MITAAVLTLSDKGSKGERTDESGPAISKALRGIGEVRFYDILPDERDLIKERLLSMPQGRSYPDDRRHWPLSARRYPPRLR